FLPESSFKSSSTSSKSQLPHSAKLNRREGEGGWAPERSDRQPWLQLDLREKMEVTAIATQGRSGSSDWVTSFMLQFSDSGLAWKQYRQSEDTGVRFCLSGNTNSEGVVQHKLVHSITARFLRFVPLDWSTTGWIGLRVEVYGCVYKSDVADFNGRSALLYRFNQKSQRTVKDVISLRFKSYGADGVLVHGEGHRGDYLTLELHHGTLALHLNLDDAKLYPSSANVSVFLGCLLDDQLWHYVLVKRSNKQVNLTVDGRTHHLSTTGVEDSLEVDYEGNVTFLCSEPQPQMVSTTFLSYSRSYLSLPLEPLGVWGLDVHFHFRTWNQEGLLFSTSLAQGSQHLVLQISRGQLHLMVHGAAEKKTNISIEVRVTDGLWHSVSLSYRDLMVSLVLDNEPTSTMDVQSHADSGNSVFFGGCPQYSGGCKNPTVAFQGCMRQILLNNQLMDLPRVQQGLLGNYSKLQFDICGIRNRCLPNFCEHDGRCTQSWDTFYCDCSGTGYTGETCHNSIYEASCEAHRQMGSTSGYFYIDPDGSGPLKATLVYCNMTEDKVWTVVGHNNSGFVNVTGATTNKPYVMRFNYTASLEQLRTLIGRSEHCQQEVVYSCRKSRLFNTWDGRPLSWWLDRSGEKQTYWGGSVPGVQQCSCSLEENCIDMNYFCNCDADTHLWVNDTGLLSNKDHLPLTEIVIGDTNRTGSAAVYRVGSLHCNGDRFLWNAASFYPGSSSLHFPKFQAELNVDISLYFKTTASSGVLLENLGTTDFITLKLTTPLAITFIFDVGNGRVDLTVTSPVPLNDKQWHYVRAERNLKEASLQVDQLPLHTLEAPSEGHYRLQLKSLLFIGGSTFKESSFLGCIRALTLNGMTLDLEEQAKLTPGVTPGCPGHCSGSASVCHNRGRCMEKNSGYVCDCTHSAYNGPHCKKEVSMSFESGSSVTLTFQMPFPVMHNRDRGSQLSSSQPDHNQSSDIYAHNGESRENVAFSFLTTHTPAMLLCVSTYNQQYLAIILANNGSYLLEKRAEIFTPKASSLADGQLHRVQVHREGKDLYVQVSIDQKYNLSSDMKMNTLRSLTLGKVTGTSAGHAGLAEEVLRAGSKGFIGCLSSVQFNHLTPLKTAILKHGSSLVHVLGNLVESNCGALADSTTSQSASGEGIDRLKKTRSDSAVIGG
uniref:Contactin associated protein-like 5b n=1 Tax=Hucho hucho TaxID=62062 RepID=A0A4W5P432_9TELE